MERAAATESAAVPEAGREGINAAVGEGGPSPRTHAPVCIRCGWRIQHEQRARAQEEGSRQLSLRAGYVSVSRVCACGRAPRTQRFRKRVRTGRGRLKPEGCRVVLRARAGRSALEAWEEPTPSLRHACAACAHESVAARRQPRWRRTRRCAAMRTPGGVVAAGEGAAATTRRCDVTATTTTTTGRTTPSGRPPHNSLKRGARLVPTAGLSAQERLAEEDWPVARCG
eukprot:161258-Chlamydomonas_euryale.AAC.1